MRKWIPRICYSNGPNRRYGYDVDSAKIFAAFYFLGPHTRTCANVNIPTSATIVAATADLICVLFCIALWHAILTMLLRHTRTSHMVSNCCVWTPLYSLAKSITARTLTHFLSHSTRRCLNLRHNSSQRKTVLLNKQCPLVSPSDSFRYLAISRSDRCPVSKFNFWN